MNIRVAAITNAGQAKNLNQDVVYAKKWVLSDREVGVIAVADGMGGHENGEIAARTAINCLDKYCASAFSRNTLTVKDLSAILDSAFRTAHDSVMAVGKQSGVSSGTTLTVCILCGDEYIVKNTGDTRCYELLGRSLRQISTDDSWVAEQVIRGTLTEVEAHKHQHQNKLTRCIGLGKYAPPHTVIERIMPDQLFFVCSDGFYKTLKQEEVIAAITLWREDNSNPLTAVLPTIYEREERDNISLCLMC